MKPPNEKGWGSIRKSNSFYFGTLHRGPDIFAGPLIPFHWVGLGQLPFVSDSTADFQLRIIPSVTRPL